VLDAMPPFDPAAGGSADYELNIRIARRFAIGCHHQVILEYRRHGANMSADAGPMLKSAVSVRRSLRRHIRGDPAAERALTCGIETVRADFGARLVEQVKTDLITRGRRMKAPGAMLYLLRYYPAGALKIMSDGFRRLTGRSRSPAPRDPPRRHG
jgi:hypothetical protein